MFGGRIENRFWAWNAAAWLGIGLVGATQTVFVMRSQGMHHAWTTLFITEVLAWIPWALATPAVFVLARRFPPLERRSGENVAVHVAACGAVAVASAAWVALLERSLNPWSMSPAPPPFAQLWEVRLGNGLLQSVFLYGGCLAVRYALETRDRLVRREADAARMSDQLAQARLRALQQQLEPHFLFNALNTVTGLIREQRNDTAVRAVSALGECLRRVLRGSDGAFVTLAHELEFLDQYLDLQRLRFGDALRFTVDAPVEIRQYLVPNLVLQPLVDNAVKHGISRRARGGTIRIGAAARDGMLHLTVDNDGPAAATPGEAGFGIGLTNLEARLRMLYGDAFQLVMDRIADRVMVSVRLPLRP